MGQPLGFGIGQLSLIPSGSNPTPVQVGILQDLSVDFDGELVELYGENQYAVDLAIGKRKISGKAKSGQIGSKTLGAILSGSTSATGSKIGVASESGTVPGTSAYTVTVAHGANFYENLGVRDTTSDIPMICVASPSAANEYSVNTSTGVYTFASGAASHGVKISYSYTDASTGKTLSITNQPMGTITLFALELFNTHPSSGKSYGIKLNKVAVPKLALALKQDGHAMSDIDFMAMDDGTGAIGSYFSNE